MSHRGGTHWMYFDVFSAIFVYKIEFYLNTKIKIFPCGDIQDIEDDSD